jgi:hypothetical protein
MKPAGFGGDFFATFFFADFFFVAGLFFAAGFFFFDFFAMSSLNDLDTNKMHWTEHKRARPLHDSLAIY